MAAGAPVAIGDGAAAAGGDAANVSRRLLSPFNSIHAHMLAMLIAVILCLTGITLATFYAMSDPQGPPLTVYEISRLARGLPLVESPGVVRVRRRAPPPPRPASETERLVSSLLAARLGLPPADVRVTLDRLAYRRPDAIVRRVALYEPDQRQEVRVLGTFSIGVRRRDGWTTMRREPYGVLDRWRTIGWQGVLLGALLVLPLVLWFSARLSRPIKAFAASAQRLGGARQAEPVAVAGPSEIRLAARALNEMQGRIARFVGERTALMGAIAHDLRTPLARLHFHLNAAPEAVREAASGEIAEMERLIDVVLQFVENETRTPVREPLDLSMLVEGVADDFADLGRDVAVIAAEPVVTLGDPLLLKRMFVNIVDNALKYGVSATITVRRAGDLALVAVADRGPGMSAEELTRAFEPFFRGEPSRNRGTGGAGLGLSIVRSAAIAHDGGVTLANAPAGGLVVTATLPIRAPAAAAR